jgi:hypothetical protein
MTAGAIWWLIGIGAAVIGLYVLLLIFTSSRDRWPR